MLSTLGKLTLRCVFGQSDTRGRCKQMILVVLVLLGFVTVVESMPESGRMFYGLDHFTVVGQRSTTEVFTIGGTYRLHDFSLTTPGCDNCEPVEARASYGAQVETRAVDFFSRIWTTVETQIAPKPSAARVIGIPDAPVQGRAVSPETPPPKATS